MPLSRPINKAQWNKSLEKIEGGRGYYIAYHPKRTPIIDAMYDTFL